MTDRQTTDANGKNNYVPSPFGDIILLVGLPIQESQDQSPASRDLSDQTSNQGLVSISPSYWWAINPIALRKAKIVCNFGLSECNRIKHESTHSLTILAGS